MSSLVDLEDMCDSESENEDRKRELSKIQKNFKKKEKQNKPFDKDQIESPGNVPGTQKVYVKTFGCSHNVSDSEYMMGQLVEYGYKLVDDPMEADCLLINSCTVKNPSQENLMRMVFDSKKIKKPVVVAGCVPQGDGFIDGLQDVSVIGVTQIDRVVEVVEETLKGNSIQLLKKKDLPQLDLPKIRKNRFIEIISINVGCLGNCTYCKTKHARGHLGSYTPESILQRMLKACEEGVSEIWLTSEDTGAYGRDIGTNIVELLVLLVKNLPKDKMLRVGMTNPPYILEHLDAMCEILNHPQVFSFLHIPVQAGSDTVLERMNREYTVEEFERVCDAILARVKDMSISTDIICGFPGETEEEFEGTMNLLKKYKFPAVNISQFYARPGTVANRMKQCNTKDKKNRSRAVTTLFESYKTLKGMEGRIERVSISERETNKHNGDCLIGHTKNYSKVVLPYKEGLLGKQVIVKITECFTWHVTGEIVDANPPALSPSEHYFDRVEAEYHKKKEEAEMQKKLREEERQNKLNKLRAEAEAKKKELANAANQKRVAQVVQVRGSQDPKKMYQLLALGIAFIILGSIFRIIRV